MGRNLALTSIFDRGRRWSALGPLILLLATAEGCAFRKVGAISPAPPSVRLMAVGDSITAGGATFESYLSPLADRLSRAGYAYTFVGTQTTLRPAGMLAHEGYGGRTAEFLAATVPDHFRAHPADLVLLHSGHNHFAEEDPIGGILAATEQLIAELRTINPKVTILLATVIPAGKLPKYAYIPSLNREIRTLAGRLDTPRQRVILVEQAAEFDWRSDTLDDLVHPNAKGAEKMASVWYRALVDLLPPPKRPAGTTPLISH